MKRIQTNGHKTNSNSRFIAILSFSLFALTVSSCSAITGIFEAGMGFGMYLILAVFVIIAFFIMRLRKK